MPRAPCKTGKYRNANNRCVKVPKLKLSAGTNKPCKDPNKFRNDNNRCVKRKRGVGRPAAPKRKLPDALFAWNQAVKEARSTGLSGPLRKGSPLYKKSITLHRKYEKMMGPYKGASSPRSGVQDMSFASTY